MQQLDLLGDRLALLLFLMRFQRVPDQLRAPGDLPNGFAGELLDLLGPVILRVTDDPGGAGGAAGIPAVVKVVVLHFDLYLVCPLHPFPRHVPLALRAADQPGQHVQAAGVAGP